MTHDAPQTMTALLSGRQDGAALYPLPAEMAVWDPSEELLDPAQAFRRADEHGLRAMGWIGLVAVATIVCTVVAQWMVP